MRGTFEAEEIEVVWICCKKSRGCGDKKDVGLENRTKRCRPVKQWIDVIEEDMRQKGVMRRDTVDRNGCKRAVKRLAKYIYIENLYRKNVLITC